MNYVPKHSRDDDDSEHCIICEVDLKEPNLSVTNKHIYSLKNKDIQLYTGVILVQVKHFWLHT